MTLLSNKKSDTSVISSFAYVLDPTGNRTKMSIAGSAYTSADIAYTYDDAYQLTGEVRTGGDAYSQVFYYDPSGNRTKKTLDASDTVYVYNEADQLTSETTGGTTTTYEYDANGALTKSDDGTTVKAYSYDYDGYLAAFDTTGTDNDATYAYDADKRRVAKTVDDTTTKYFLDGADVIADYDGDNALLATYLTPGLDRNLSQTRSGSTYYYMADGLGSIRNLVDSSETTQNTYDYYAFGKELGTWTEGVTNRYTYTAREWDDESQQYYYRARYYDASGRFSRRDSIAPFSYSYVSSNPLVYSDPQGLQAQELQPRDVIFYGVGEDEGAFAGWATKLTNSNEVLRAKMAPFSTGMQFLNDLNRYVERQQRPMKDDAGHFLRDENGNIRKEWVSCYCLRNVYVLQHAWSFGSMQASRSKPGDFAGGGLPGEGSWVGFYADALRQLGNDAATLNHLQARIEATDGKKIEFCTPCNIVLTGCRIASMGGSFPGQLAAITGCNVFAAAGDSSGSDAPHWTSGGKSAEENSYLGYSGYYKYTPDGSRTVFGTNFSTLGAAGEEGLYGSSINLWTGIGETTKKPYKKDVP